MRSRLPDCSVRYLLGRTPYARRNAETNERVFGNPFSAAMSSMRFSVRSRSRVAARRRRDVRYCEKVTPMVRSKDEER